MTISRVQELEVKILEVDIERLTEKLEKLGANKVLDAVTYIYCFDITRVIDYTHIPEKLHQVVQIAQNLTKDGNTLRQQNFHLRMRKQEDKYEFTLKYSDGQKGKLKRETEVNVELTTSDWAHIKEDMILAGLDIVANQQKKRISYDLGKEGLHFDIDTWPGIPTYLEIEGSDEGKIMKFIHKLGLENHSTTNISGEEFFNRYGISFYSDLIFEI